MDVLKLLNQVRSGEVEVAEAAGLLKKLPYEELGFAKLDHHRELRRGCGEVVFCPGKAPQHLVAIFRRFHEQGSRVMGTRASEEQAALVRDAIPSAAYDRCHGSSGSESFPPETAISPSAPAEPPTSRSPKKRRKARNFSAAMSPGFTMSAWPESTGCWPSSTQSAPPTR